MFGLFKKPATSEQLEFALLTTTGIHLKTFGIMPNGEQILNNVEKVLSEVGCKLSHDQVRSIKAASSLIALSSELAEKFKAMVSAGANTDGKIYAEIVMTMRRSGIDI